MAPDEGCECAINRRIFAAWALRDGYCGKSYARRTRPDMRRPDRACPNSAFYRLTPYGLAKKNPDGRTHRGFSFSANRSSPGATALQTQPFASHQATLASGLVGARLVPGLGPLARGGTYADNRQLTPSIFFPPTYRVTWQQITSPASDNCAM